MNKPNTVYDMEIDSLNKLLEDAEADEELTQLVSESEETEKAPTATGTEEKKPEEVEVKTVEDPTCTNQEAEDIKPVETEKENTPTEKQVEDSTKAEDEKSEEKLKEEVETGTEEKKPEEVEVKDADPTETVSNSTDIDLKKPIQDGEHSDIKVEDPTCTNQEATDIKPAESEKEKIVKEEVSNSNLAYDPKQKIKPIDIFNYVKKLVPSTVCKEYLGKSYDKLYFAEKNQSGRINVGNPETKNAVASLRFSVFKDTLVFVVVEALSEEELKKRKMLLPSVEGLGLMTKIIKTILDKLPGYFNISINHDFNPDFWKHILEPYAHKFKSIDYSGTDAIDDVDLVGEASYASSTEDEKLNEEPDTTVPTLEQLELKDTDDSSLEEDLTFGTEERTPDDEHIEYVDPTHTVEETEDIDLKKPIQDGEHSDINIEDPTCTNQEAEDIKPVESEKENTPTEKQVADATKAEDEKLNEAIDELNKFIMSLNEEEGLPEDKVGTEERAPKEETVKDADPTCTKQEAEDVAPAKPECCEHKECKSVKEVIEAGTDNFKTEEEKKKLTECIALVLAHENNDLMFEEYNRLLSEAISLRESLIKKYSIIATNRTNSLLEGMTQMEERLKNTKNDMFKKLNEQKEINSAKDNTKVLNPETAAFTNTDKLKVDL